MHKKEILRTQVPRQVRSLEDSDKVHFYNKSKADRAERFTTQILTEARVGFNNDGGSGNHYTLLELVQIEINNKLQQSHSHHDPIDLVAGDYERDDFIGKMLCHKRYKTYARFCCNDRDECKNTWTSDSTTVEMIVQKSAAYDKGRRACNVIIRSYLQLCKKCRNIGSTQLQPRSVKPLVNKMVVDILKYYGVRVNQAPQEYRRNRRNQAPHEQDLCLACLQGSCAWKWPNIDDEVQKLHDIYYHQLPQMEPSQPQLKVMYRILALYKQYGEGPNQGPRPIGDINSISHEVALGVWEAWCDLGDMDKLHAAKELLPLLRRHIDWCKVFIQDFTDGSNPQGI